MAQFVCILLLWLLLLTGRIRAIQLDYSESHRHLIQAIRKAPQSGAIGFKQTVRKCCVRMCIACVCIVCVSMWDIINSTHTLQAHKFAIVVQLLLGEIPDKATFREPTLKKPLLPYFRLTQGIAISYLLILVDASSTSQLSDQVILYISMRFFSSTNKSLLKKKLTH